MHAKRSLAQLRCAAPQGGFLAADGREGHISGMKEFLIKPDPDDPRLTQRVKGLDQDGREIETSVVTELGFGFK